MGLVSLIQSAPFPRLDRQASVVAVLAPTAHVFTSLQVDWLRPAGVGKCPSSLNGGGRGVSFFASDARIPWGAGECSAL